jgi:hypothetical protein
MLAPGMTLKPTKVAWGEADMKQLDDFALTSLRQNISDWNEFHNTKIPEQRRIYEGRPRDAVKSFPWPGASNVVVQVVGQTVDTLHSSIMASLYEMSPLWPVSLLGNWSAEDKAEEQRQALEDFLTQMALDQDELDWYRVQGSWLFDHLKHGLGVVKIPQTSCMEVEYFSLDGTQGAETEVERFNGPKPEKVALEDFVATITAPSIKDAGFKANRVRLKKWDLEERVATGKYDKAAVDKILKSPDSSRMSPERQKELQEQGLNPSSEELNSAEWQIWECWFPYWRGSKKFRLITAYHLNSGTRLRAEFNFYPQNEEPYIGAKLGHGDGILGRGFSDLLKDYQEEITVGHNQRVDKRTLCNTNIFQIDPNSGLDAHFKFFPGCTVPAGKDMFQVVSLGNNTYPQSVEDEMLTIRLHEDRAGVGTSTSAMGGMGSGTVGKSQGVYSSMGTYAVMQSGSKREMARITDFKMAHMRAGKLLALMYAWFGPGKKLDYFGKDREYIERALDGLLTKKLGFQVKAATASINKEVEKQNFLLLTNIMQRHYTAIGQMLQGALNQQLPPQIQQYLVKAIEGSESLMAKVLHVFDIDDKSRILPKGIEGLEDGAMGAAGQGPEGSGVSGNSLGDAYSSQPGEGAGLPLV